MRARFVPTTLFVMAGLLIWMLDLAFTYSFVAVACARRFADARFAGIGVVPLTVALATVVCAAATAAVLAAALRACRLAGGDDPTARTRRFVAFMAGAVAAFSLVAIAWNGFAAALPAC